MDDLKPCPFCGHNDIEPCLVDIEDREGFPIAMMCGNCGSKGPWTYTRNNEDSTPAVELWNTRCDPENQIATHKQIITDEQPPFITCWPYDKV